MVLSLLIVLELRVEDRRDEGRGCPAADPGSGLRSGIVLRLIVAEELVGRAATNGRATLHEWTHIAGREIYVQGNAKWSQSAPLLPLNLRKNTV